MYPSILRNHIFNMFSVLSILFMLSLCSRSSYLAFSVMLFLPNKNLNISKCLSKILVSMLEVTVFVLLRVAFLLMEFGC